MHATSRNRWQLRLANIVFVLLFLVAIGLLQWLSREYSLHFDFTNTARHSLSNASIVAAERLRGPIAITAYASKRGESRALIQELVSRYQRHKPDITLSFIDPDESPDKARNAGVLHEGELFFIHADAKERLAPPMRLDEESFTNTLTRLGHRGERWVVFLSGHGERNPDRQANFDLSTWAGELKRRGFQTRVLSFAESARIPDNTSILVIAGPRTQLLPGEVKAIQKHVEHGGNLLWLADPGPASGLDPLAEMLGVEFLPGTAMDPNSALRTSFMNVIALDRYGSHPIVRDFFDLTTVFPTIGALRLNAPKGWQGATLLDTSESTWLETEQQDTPVVFDKGKDLRGPLTIGVTLARKLEDSGGEQRVAVIADGDFLSNSFLPNGANLDLGLSVINWLSRDEAYVSIPVRAAPDKTLNLSPAVHMTIEGVFFYLLPFGLIAGGVAVWWRRRKR